MQTEEIRCSFCQALMDDQGEALLHRASGICGPPELIAEARLMVEAITYAFHDGRN